ncbi:MAG: hypothetical protein J6K39_00240 [Clostridia bacterium]|nr:hypothetical protein [Clostridia bacterium]
MMSMLCGLWDDFSAWVTLEWSQMTYVLVMCALGILGTFGLLSFLKQSKGKEKKPFKWSSLVLCLLLYGLLAVLAFARM